MGERQSIEPRGVRAIDARKLQLEMAQVLQKPVFVLPGSQQMSVNTLSSDALGLGAKKSPQICFGVCFCNEHVGHAQATATGHTHETMEIPEIFFRFLSQSQKKKSSGIFVFFSLFIASVRMATTCLTRRTSKK